MLPPVRLGRAPRGNGIGFSFLPGGENWAHVFGDRGWHARHSLGEIRQAVGPVGQDGRRAGGLADWQVGRGRHHRNHARARFWAEEGEGERGAPPRYLFAVERNGCLDEF